MNRFNRFLAAVLAASPLPVLAGECGWVSLFNGENLDGWTPKVSGYPAGENPGDIFRVEDGFLTVSYEAFDAFDSAQTDSDAGIRTLNPPTNFAASDGVSEMEVVLAGGETRDHTVPLPRPTGVTIELRSWRGERVFSADVVSVRMRDEASPTVLFPGATRLHGTASGRIAALVRLPAP